MRRANLFGRRVVALSIAAVVCGALSDSAFASTTWQSKLDPITHRRLADLTASSRVILQGRDAGSLEAVLPLVQLLGGRLGAPLPLLHARVVTVPNAALATLASSSLVQRISYDRLVLGAVERTGGATGAEAVRQQLGYTGSGIGVAVIDSGISRWHDDLMDEAGGMQRVDRFVDLVHGRSAPYDDNGHGTHVAGIIAGNGYDSDGARTGIAPAARLTVLKVLDETGRGRISDVIAALDYVVRHRDTLGIRVVNLSVAASVYESFETDPLTVAARRVVSAGIVVVAAAGNAGRAASGRTQYGAIAAPGNAPWVLTVGASSHAGTVDRSDDAMAAFSSRGPSAVDRGAKPDLVAPGVGIESLSDPASAFYTEKSRYLLDGTVPTSYFPYLSLTGTSMAAPVVSGTVALMLQANPALTPNAVKGILQYTAQTYPGYDRLTQGTGFLNARGAVELARYLASPGTFAYPSTERWAQRILWGNYLVHGGRITGDANAWARGVIWGSERAHGGVPVAWGVLCASTECEATAGPWEWGSGRSTNVVWGSSCGGSNCSTPWHPTVLAADAHFAAEDGDTVVWGTGSDDEDTVVWGTSRDEDTVVWGTSQEGDTVVWGTSGNEDTVVWGTSADDGDTVVWGTSCTDPSCDSVVWDSR